MNALAVAFAAVSILVIIAASAGAWMAHNPD